jgi:large subunit ribosomal protein L29
MKRLLQLSDAELNETIRTSSREVLDLRLKKQSGQLKNPAELRALRKKIARVGTVLSIRRRESSVRK